MRSSFPLSPKNKKTPDGRLAALYAGHIVEMYKPTDKGGMRTKVESSFMPQKCTVGSPYNCLFQYRFFFVARAILTKFSLLQALR